MLYPPPVIFVFIFFSFSFLWVALLEAVGVFFAGREDPSLLGWVARKQGDRLMHTGLSI